jgi:hypothetical protein
LVYPDSNAEWRWGLHSGDGRETARAPRGHKHKTDCVADAQSFRQSLATTPIIDQDQNPYPVHKGGRGT